MSYLLLIGISQHDGHAASLLIARDAERAATLFQVLVAPAIAVLMSQQVALNPALFGTGFNVIFGESAFPDAPKNARETAAPIAVSKASARDDEAVIVGSLPTFGSFCDQSFASAATSK